MKQIQSNQSHVIQSQSLRPAGGAAPDVEGVDRRDAIPTEDDPGWRGAGRSILARSGGVSGLVAVALPPATFTLVNASWSLSGAVLCAIAAAIGGLALRAALGEPLRHGLGGLLIAAVCAGVAGLTGEARTYFLLQLLVSGTSSLVCVASVLARRPLAGILLNRVVGGPAQWRRLERLVRVYSISTLACAAYSGLSCAAQVAFYLTDHTDGLALANVIDGPAWATISMAIIVAARRSVATSTSPLAP
jgi:Protein of unknown function (DUF3159)